MQSRHASILALLAIGFAAMACGCSSDAVSDPGTISETAAAVVTSDQGSLNISVHSAPETQPTRGVNTLRLVVTRVSDGTPVSGLALDVVPWMPAMGHGASVKPSVEPGPDPGSYDVHNVALFMPGLWEIRTTISGTSSDHVAPKFDIR